MKLALTLSVLAFSVMANAATAPGYNSLNKLDTAIKTWADLRNKNPGDVTVAGAVMGRDQAGRDIVKVDLGGAKCKFEISLKLPPKGMTGKSGYRAKLRGCERYINMRAPDVMKYEEARPALAEAASQGKKDLSFQVSITPQGLAVKFLN